MSIQLIADQVNKKLVLKDTSRRHPIVSKDLMTRTRTDLSGLITDFTEIELNQFANVDDLVELILTKPAKSA
jgi:hypothetical protein